MGPLVFNGVQPRTVPARKGKCGLLELLVGKGGSSPGPRRNGYAAVRQGRAEMGTPVPALCLADVEMGTPVPALCLADAGIGKPGHTVAGGPPPELCRDDGRPAIVVLLTTEGDRYWNGNQWVQDRDSALVVNLDDPGPGKSAVMVAVNDLEAGRVAIIPAFRKD